MFHRAFRLFWNKGCNLFWLVQHEGTIKDSQKEAVFNYNLETAWHIVKHKCMNTVKKNDY